MKNPLLTTAVVALAGLALSACGSASPGVAVQVGEAEISTTEVDRATDEMCTALSDQLEAAGQVLPMSFVRQGVVQLMTVREQAEQLAEEYGVEAGSTYTAGRRQQEAQASALPEDVRDTYVELTSTNAYASDIVEQVGRIVLTEQGVSDPTSEEASEAGLDVFTVWPDVNGIDIDPRYGLESVDGALVPTDTNLSTAVSDLAEAGLAAEPDPAYAESLPVTQRCG